MGGRNGVFDLLAKFVEAVAVAAGGGIRRDAEEFADPLEGEVMPELQDDDLALFPGKPGEGALGGVLVRGNLRRRFKPALGLEFAGEPAPEGSAMVEGAVAEGADEVEPGFAGRVGEVEQGLEGVVEDILRLGVAKTEGAPVEKQLGGAGVVEACCPRPDVVGFQSHGTQ